MASDSYSGRELSETRRDFSIKSEDASVVRFAFDCDLEKTEWDAEFGGAHGDSRGTTGSQRSTKQPTGVGCSARTAHGGWHVGGDRVVVGAPRLAE